MQTVSRLTETFAPSHYSLSLDIDRPGRSFKGTVSIQGELLQDGPIKLHAKDLTINDCVIDGHAASVTIGENDEITATFDGLLPGTHMLVLGFSGTINDHMHGMYPCYFEHEGEKKELVATQFESHHAREVFPCVDEPEAKATYDVTLLTEPVAVVLGNMPVVSQKTEGNRLVTTFGTTPRMSSYLLAWVYGDLHKKTAHTKRNVEVNVWATPVQSSESLYFALDIAVRATEFFEEYFGVDYPLPKCDHVALPDFSSGAMENWGLITYREAVLLADPKTASITSKRWTAMVVAHELSHQWFGNLVTMRWWNNLWLNESFANLMEYLAPDALHPEWNLWLDFSSQETVMSLRRDAIDGVQPVQVDVHHPDEITTLFDPAIVYAKGGRLIRMLLLYIGEEAFRAGLKSYFEKHAYGNTEEDDLWDAFAVASGKNITGFMTDWITQPGYPVVHVSPTGLRQEQFFIGPHTASKQLWPLPLDASDASLPAIFETANLDVAVPAGTNLNVRDGSHFISHYETSLFAALVQSVQAGTLAPIGRFQLLHEQTLLARAGIVPSADLVPLLSAYENETSENVWEIIAGTIGELKKFVEQDTVAEKALKQLTGRVAAKQFARLGWDMQTGEPETDTKLRATILGLMVYAEDSAVLAEAKKRYDTLELDAMDPELRPLLLSAVVRHFADKAAAEKLFEQYKSTHSSDLQLDICAGLTSTRDPEVIAMLLGMLIDTKAIRTQDTSRWFAYLVRNREARTSAWQWMKDNWGWIETTFGGDKSYDSFPRYSATGLVTRDQLADYKAFFEPKKSVAALNRVISMGISEIEGRVEVIERDGEAVRAALTN